jgi:hypothetical protein
MILFGFGKELEVEEKEYIQSYIAEHSVLFFLYRGFYDMPLYSLPNQYYNIDLIQQRSCFR